MTNSTRGRVQTPDLDLRQAIRPQGLPGSTFIRPPEASRDNSLLQIADALSGVNAGLRNYSTKLRRDRAEQTDSWKTQAEADSIRLSPEEYKKRLDEVPVDARKFYEAGAGFSDAADYQTALTDAYNNNFNRDTDDVYSWTEGFRRKYVADRGITDPHRLAAFGRATDPMHGDVVGFQKKYLGEKLDMEKASAAKSNYELAIQQVKREGGAPVQIGRLLSELGGEWKDAKGGSLTPKQHDAILGDLAAKYAAQGDVETTKAILSSQRGGRGSLLQDSEYAAAANATLESAISQSQKNALARDPYEKAKVKLRAYQGIASDDEINGAPTLSSSEKTEYFAARDSQRQENEKRRIDAESLAEWQKQFDVSRKASLLDLRTKTLDPNSGFTGVVFQDMVTLDRKDPTKEIVYTAKEQKDDLIELHEAETAVRLQQELAVAGSDSVAQQKAVESANAAHLQFYGTLAEPRRQWAAQMNGAVTAVPGIIASKGAVPKAVEDAYAVYSGLMTQNPALVSMMVKDDNTRLLFETFGAVRQAGSAPAEAWVTAAERVRLKAENKLPPFSASARDISDKMRGSWDGGGIPATGLMINEVRTQAEILFQTGHMTEDEALSKAAERVKANYTEINGAMVYTAQAGIPKDFGDKVERKLGQLVEMYGTERSIGKDGAVTSTVMVDDEDELIVTPMAGSANEWNVVIKAEGRNLLDDSGKPVTITLDDLDLLAQSDQLDEAARHKGKDSTNYLYATDNFLGQGVPFVLGGLWETQEQHENALKELQQDKMRRNREGEPLHWLDKKNPMTTRGFQSDYGPSGKYSPQKMNRDSWLDDVAVDKAEVLIAKNEDFRSEPYDDGGTLRIGFGSDTITKADGTWQRVVPGMKITRDDALRDLQRRKKEFQSTIVGQIGAKRWEGFNDIQKAVLTDAAYNYGSLPKRLVAAVDSGDTNQVSLVLLRMGKDNGGIRMARYRQNAALFRGALGPLMLGGLSTKPRKGLGLFKSSGHNTHKLDTDNLNPAYKSRLSALQSRWGEDLRLNSAFRDPGTNAAVGGAKGSRHQHGDAVDIDVRDWPLAKRRDFIRMASAMGFTGIGVYRGAIHLDTRSARKAWGPSHSRASVPPWARVVIAEHLAQ
jgi:hypothetical protein